MLDHECLEFQSGKPRHCLLHRCRGSLCIVQLPPAGCMPGLDTGLATRSHLEPSALVKLSDVDRAFVCVALPPLQGQAEHYLEKLHHKVGWAVSILVKPARLTGTSWVGHVGAFPLSNTT